jgi:exodeoxyribonuclease VII large subunit
LKDGLTRSYQERRHHWDKVLLRWSAVQPQKSVTMARERVKQWAARLEALGPDATLRRGYALVLDKDGHIVKDGKSIKKGETLKVHLGKGALKTKVEEVLESEKLAKNFSQKSD